jgi:Rap1a immunity proteins
MYVAGVIDKAETDERAIFKFNADNSDNVKGLSDAQAGNLVANVARELRAVKSYCIPTGVTTGQVADVICKYLKDNPADRHKSAADLVTTALNDVRACRLSDIK